QASGQFGEEGFGQGQGKATELAVDSPLLGAEPLLVDGFHDGFTATAVIACQSIGEDVDEFGEREFLFVATSTMLVEEGLKEVRLGKESPQGIEGVGQGQAGQNINRDRLGRFRTGSHNHWPSSMMKSAKLL